MSLTIENGTGLPDAESYVTVDQLRTHARARGAVLPDDDAGCEVLLISAIDYLEAQSFAGEKTNPDQALVWPRTGVMTSGEEIASDSIPSAIQRAQMALAIEAQRGALMPSTRPSVYSRTKVGEIEVEYREAADSASVRPVFPVVEALLAPYLGNAGRSFTRVARV